MPDLKSIKVLFRSPDTLTLYGIPYDMRPGQSPGDIYRAAAATTFNPKMLDVPPWLKIEISIHDWIYLGQPGWFGYLTKEAVREIEEYLAPLYKQGIVPESPYEWVALEEKS